jgi:D-alanyl-D-alanine carboxypeptidase (penicillin-binding protein 5/6)
MTNAACHLPRLWFRGFLFFLLLPGRGFAQNTASPPPLLLPLMAAAPELRSAAALLMDAETGTVLYAKNPGLEIPPASLTKLMTMHLVLNEAAAGRADLDEKLEPGPESWAINQPPRSSLMFLAPGQSVSLREILLGLAIPSGNDAAAAAALRFAPTLRDFAGMMNSEARRLGLVKTRFAEPSGISEHNITTAAEFAAFCRFYLKAHPGSLAEFHSVPEFAYPRAFNVPAAFREKPGTIVQENHNTLLRTFPGVDGLKTGYIDEAGYNIALTAERGGVRFIAVVLGAPAEYGGDRIRDADGERLLEWAFSRYKTLRPVPPAIPPVRVWKGRENTLDLILGEWPVYTVLVRRGEGLRWEIEVQDPVIAPIPAAAPLGRLILSDWEGELRSIPLLAAGGVERGGFFKRLWDTIRLFFYAFFSPLP